MRKWRTASGKTRDTLTEALGLDAKTIDDKLKRKLTTMIRREWRILVDQHVAQRRKAAYIKGMKVTATDTQVVLSITGWDAVKIERGWAPPQHATSDALNEGLDTYDGSMKDMKPSILNGKSRKIIKFDLAKSASQLEEEYRDMATKMAMKQAISTRFLKADVADFSRQLRGLPFSEQGKRTVSTKTYFQYREGYDYNKLMPKSKNRHRASLFARIVRTVKADGRRGWVYSIFRTMSAVGQRDLWLTRGTPPANVVDRLLERLPELVAEAMGVDRD